MAEPTTPLMRQYHAVKKQHPSALLLFRLGDFYELFYEDAIVASRELQITLTARNRERGQPVPMCGVPYHAADNYIARLVRAGYKVAICEQMEEPGKGKKLVRRDVVRVVTPGTATDMQLLDAGENSFLAALAHDAASGARRGGGATPDLFGGSVGLAYVDVSTGEFRATEFTGARAREKLRDELHALRPREILLPRGTGRGEESAAAGPASDGLSAAETRMDDWVFHEEHATRLLTEQFSVANLDGFGLAGRPLAVGAAGALVHYLRETSARGDAARALEHLDRPMFYEQQDALVLDNVTVRNLELVSPLFAEPVTTARVAETLGQGTLDGGAARGHGSLRERSAALRRRSEAGTTLLACLNETATGMGARLLRSWLLRPAMDRGEIEARLEGVAELDGRAVLREEIRKDLGHVLDLERLTSRVTLGTATPRDLIGLQQSLERIPALRQFLAHAKSARLTALDAEMDELSDVRERIARAIAEDPPAQAKDPGVIRQGYCAELDELRELGRTAKQIIAAMEERERRRTGIGSLKIRYNQVFGYYIEVSKPNLSLVPQDYQRKQTLVNAERFTMPELAEHERKALDAEQKIGEIEQRLYAELRGWIGEQAARLRRTAAGVAQLDVLANFAHLAAERQYVRPTIAEAREILIRGGRHPVIERLCEERGERFVPNDLYLNDSTHQILLITGPNMGGKSTYLRQAALIVLMAQMGSFVPATEARLPMTDRIFTRIGASDNLARGRSTFLVEMTEVAAILNTATPASLVLLDEVGRGTATFDGLAIAWAVVEQMQSVTRARTLFATHYHELTELAELLPGVKNVHVSVVESGSQIVFLRKVEPGSADKSYGIEVARLAGLPRAVIERAREVLMRHERSERKVSEELSPGAHPAGEQPAIFTPLDREVLDALREADLDNVKPIEALNLLAKLKKQL